MGQKKQVMGMGVSDLDEILAKYRPINAKEEDIARIKRLYSRLNPKIYWIYIQTWVCLMRHLSYKKGNSSTTVSNLGFLCLLDLERTLFLQRIIGWTMKKVKAPKKLNVIDLGAGTGVLGLTALELGAGSVTLVENDKECLVFLNDLLPKFGFKLVSKNKDCSRFSRGGQRVELYPCDAKVFRPSNSKPRYDLVICEMHETHLVSEDEVAALKNIRKHAGRAALFIPSADELMVSVCDSGGSNLAEAAKIGQVKFSDIRARGISFKGRLIIKKGGKAKYLKLWDRLFYPEGSVSEQDFQMFTQTKYIPLKGWEPVLKRGQILSLGAKFGFGDRFYNGYYLEERFNEK